MGTADRRAGHGVESRPVGYRAAAGLGAHVWFADHVEVDRFDLVGAGRDDVDQQLLHAVEVGASEGVCSTRTTRNLARTRSGMDFTLAAP
jgi:hypothetical protein